MHRRIVSLPPLRAAQLALQALRRHAHLETSDDQRQKAIQRVPRRALCDLKGLGPLGRWGLRLPPPLDEHG